MFLKLYAKFCSLEAKYNNIDGDINEPVDIEMGNDDNMDDAVEVS